MSEIESQYVKTGVWTNLDKGPVMGQTITTNIRTGTIVVALLAIFTSLGLSHLFHLLTFLYHQVRADGEPGDGHFRQQQVLLRTLPTPSSLIADSAKLWYLWRNISKNTTLRSLGIVILSACFAVGSIIASIFSSFVVDNTNIEVLVSSPNCAFLNTSSVLSDTSLMSYMAAVEVLMWPYEDDCYGNTTSLPARCKVFTRPRVEFKLETESCPFENLCSSPAITFDSGLVDVGKQFGLNLPKRHSVKYRKKDTCAILSQEGHVSQVSAAEVPQVMFGRPPLPQEEVLWYHYGTPMNPGVEENNTFGISLLASNVTRQFTTTNVIRMGDPELPVTFKPLPEMARDDGDLTVRVIRKNGVIFLNPVDDLMFAAHKRMEIVILDTSKNVEYYLADSHSAIIGCIEQYQYCIDTPNHGEICSPLNGVPASVNSSYLPESLRNNATDIQRSVIDLLARVARVFAIHTISHIKTSTFLGSSGAVEALPNDQWIQELQSWESYVWTAHQIAIADYAIGPKSKDSQADPYTTAPTTKGDKALCGMQKMRKSGDFVNINVFALAFLLSISGTVALLDIVILRFLVYVSSFRKSLSPKIDRWLQDNVFQLQRRAYEARDEGSWIRQNKEVPVTVEETKLTDLPVYTKTRFDQNSFSLKSPTTLTEKPSFSMVENASRKSSDRCSERSIEVFPRALLRQETLVDRSSSIYSEQEIQEIMEEGQHWHKRCEGGSSS